MNPRPLVSIDLVQKSNYSHNGHRLLVSKVNISKEHDVYIQVIQPVRVFDVSHFHMNNKNIFKPHKKKENVHAIFVYFHKKTDEVVIFETCTFDNDPNDVVRRFFAKTKLGDKNEETWVEYMPVTGESINYKNLDRIIKAVKEGTMLHKLKAQDNFFNLVRVHGRIIPKSEHLRPSEPEVVKQTEVVEFVDLEGQTTEIEVKEFFMTKTGMATTVAGGSVGGVAIGGAIIYLFTNFT